MQKKKLGNTGLDVTKICLGTMTWGSQNTEAEAHEQLYYAIKEAGINFIDTAEMYAVPPDPKTCNLTETYVWNWLAKNPEVRKDIIIASKMVGPGLEWIRWGEGIVPSKMREAVEGSLSRLQIDCIDLYQLHWPQRQVPKFGKLNWHESMLTSKEQEEAHILEVLKAFDELRKEGKVKYLGLSNDTPWGVMKFLELARRHNLPEVQTVQNSYHLLNRGYEVGLAEVSAYEGVGCLAYSPLAGWVLTGKYANGAMPEWSRYALWGNHRQAQHFNPRTLKMTDNLSKLAKKLWISVTQLSLAWVNDRWFVHSNIIGATSLEQLKENISSAEITLSTETRQEIDNMFSQCQNPATY